MESDHEQIQFLQREWNEIGRLVLRDHGVEDDLQSVHEWVSWFIVNGKGEERFELILSYIDHSLNLDIPFAASARVRETLIAIARQRMRL